MRIVALIASTTGAEWWSWALGLGALAGIVTLAYEVAGDRPQPVARRTDARAASLSTDTRQPLPVSSDRSGHSSRGGTGTPDSGAARADSSS